MGFKKISITVVMMGFLSACGKFSVAPLGNSGGQSLGFSPQSPIALSVKITANGQKLLFIQPGETYNVAWESQGLRVCKLSASDGQTTNVYDVQPNGAGPSSSPGIYTITCYFGAEWATDSVEIRLAPKPEEPRPEIQLSANGQDALLINAGETYNVMYSSKNVKYCTMNYARPPLAGGEYGLPINTAGQGASGEPASYTMTCLGNNGEVVAKTITVSVNSILAAPGVSASINGQPRVVVPEGSTNVVNFTSVRAQNCVVSYSVAGSTAGGEHWIAPNTSSSGATGAIGSYTLTCGNGQKFSSSVVVISNK